jgi:hypothetical protein
VDGKKTGTVAWPALSSNRTAPLKPKEGLSGPPAFFEELTYPQMSQRPLRRLL